MITIENLTKKFGGVTAAEGLTFQVKEGEVFGFLGPNGAGDLLPENSYTMT
jgi:ABC-type multidrug transport system ATPase subunit